MKIGRPTPVPVGPPDASCRHANVVVPSRMDRTESDANAPSRRPAAGFHVVRTRPEHAAQVASVIRAAHRVSEHDPCFSCFREEHVRRQIRRFPEGQFVAVEAGPEGRDRVVGCAVLMRTDVPPERGHGSWLRTIGSLGLHRHEPNGRWLYGVEMAVHPDAQGRGVGSALYRHRLRLVGELGLEGLYAGGLLKGYRRYRRRLSPRAYADRVRGGQIEDPTVSMQLRKGFRAEGVLEHYDDDVDSGDCAVLIVWRAGAKRPDRLPAPVVAKRAWPRARPDRGRPEGRPDRRR